MRDGNAAHKIKAMYVNKYHPHYAMTGVFVAYDKSGSKEHFTSEQAAKDHSERGSFIEYKGFQISASTFQIFKSGKVVFNAPWQDCDTLEKAKQIIDVSIACKAEEDRYATFQMNKYGNVIGSTETTPDGELYENGLEELDRLADYINAQSERELHEKEY